MIDVFYKSPRGASIGLSFSDEGKMLECVKKLRKHAIILVKGRLVGRVWKDDKRWQWFYDPALIAPNTGVEPTVSTVGKNQEGLGGSRPSH